MTKILSIRQSFLPEVTPWTFLGGSHTCFLSFSLLNKGDSFLLPPWFSHYWGPPQTWPDISQHFISLHFSTFLYISLHFSAVEKCREMSRNARVKSGGDLYCTLLYMFSTSQSYLLYLSHSIPLNWSPLFGHLYDSFIMILNRCSLYSVVRKPGWKKERVSLRREKEKEQVWDLPRKVQGVRVTSERRDWRIPNILEHTGSNVIMVIYSL